MVLFDHLRSRLNRDGAVLSDERDEPDEEDESAMDGTQFGRGKTDSWCGFGPGRGCVTGASRGRRKRLRVSEDFYRL